MLALDRPVVEPDANHQSVVRPNARTTTSPAGPVRTASSEIGIVNVEFNRIAIFHVVASLLWDRIRKTLLPCCAVQSELPLYEKTCWPIRIILSARDMEAERGCW
jgi:hypothetical protein